VTVRAKEPFRFCSRLTLSLLTGQKAGNLEELLDHLRRAPDMVIYQHTHRFLQQHQALVPEPPNDFAYWVTHTLLDEDLGERLAAVDTVRAGSLGALRDDLAATIERALRGPRQHLQAPAGKEFYFMRTVRFSLPTDHYASDLREFLDSLGKVSIFSLYLHVFEARLRPPLGVNDFSLWFERELGEVALARAVDRLDPYTQTMEGLRRKIAGLVEERVKELDRAGS
jgi:hypothetical protein